MEVEAETLEEAKEAANASADFEIGTAELVDWEITRVKPLDPV